MDLPTEVFGKDRISLFTSAHHSCSGDMRIERLPDLSTCQSKYLAISTFLDLDSRLSIGCAGALLANVTRRREIFHSPPQDPDEPKAYVCRVQAFAADNFV